MDTVVALQNHKEDLLCLNGLNNAQKSAVLSASRCTLVLAGAGSGKTRVLVSRIAYLNQEHGISLHEILAVTFTNKAAFEMKTRLATILNQAIDGIWVGTFHGLCHRFLRRHYQELNLPKDFSILDSDDQGRMIKRCLVSLNIDMERLPIKTAQNFINHQKEQVCPENNSELSGNTSDKTLLAVYHAYQKACQTAGVIDFADLLKLSYELFVKHPQIIKEYQERFKAILIDEFQDTNPIQYAWIKLLAGQSASVMAVGDDDQSIYGWRGAKIENIAHFLVDFPHAIMIRLEENYRSTATILNASNALIAHNQERMGKDLWTQGDCGEKITLYSALNEIEEAKYLADSILASLQKGVPARELAILYRSNAQSRVIEDALMRARIPYQILAGFRFFERAEIKDVLAYLRLLIHEEDDAAFERVVNLPPRGIGEQTLETLKETARLESCSLFQAIPILTATESTSSRAKSALHSFMNLIAKLKENLIHLNLDEQIDTVILSSGLLNHYAKLGDKLDAKRENLQELINAAKEFRFERFEDENVSPLVAFLSQASLDGLNPNHDEVKDYISMMTMHAAKGLEFTEVYAVGMEEGLFPSKLSLEDPGRLEEERRLCYVAMTRAKKTLVMTYAQLRRQYGREEHHRPSRFLTEIPAIYLSSFQATVPVRKAVWSLKNESGFGLGQSVNHPRFGEGVVLAFQGSGPSAQIQVNFKNHGVKWLVIAYANLAPLT